MSKHQETAGTMVSMLLRMAAVLSLASHLALADPGLRGADAAAQDKNQTLVAAPDQAADPIVEQQAAQPADIEPGFILPDVVLQAGLASNGTGGGGGGGQVSAEDAFTTYWDGQCTPCPAYLYPHCSQGGQLSGRRSCCKWGSCAYCEGLCTVAGAPPGFQPPTPIEPPSPAPAPISPAPAPISPAPVSPIANVMTLYHETSPAAAASILANGFRPGTSGWCGGAIYFYNSPNVPETKLGPDSQRGAVVEAKVDLGRMAHLDSKCHNFQQAKRNYDSVTFNPGDGNEFVIFSKDRVISMKRYS